MVDSAYVPATPVGSDSALEERILREQEKYHRMPPRYIGFTIRYRSFWLGLNVFNLLSSAAMAYGCIAILGREREAESFEHLECVSMEVVGWALFSLHVVNMIFSLMALCGLEKRLCVSMLFFGLLIYDAAVLTWAHTTYF